MKQLHDMFIALWVGPQPTGEPPGRVMVSAFGGDSALAMFHPTRVLNGVEQPDPNRHGWLGPWPCEGWQRVEAELETR